MTSAESQIVGEPGREAPASRTPGSSALRRSGAIRAALAVILAGTLTAIAIVAQWGPLVGKTDLMGYPIFADFNPNNYAHAYYLTVGLFPVAALLIFVGLTWLAPRVGLAVPPSRGRLRPLAGPADAEPWFEPEPATPGTLRVAAGARVAVVGALLGLQVGVATNHLWLSIALVTIAYSLLVALGSVALGRLMSSTSTWEARLATINALGPPLTVVGLSLVSAHTAVYVQSNQSVHNYPWFPFWLGVPLGAALLAWVVVWLRRGGPARAAAIDRRSLLLIAAPTALFVLVARLPGDTGQLSLYEMGQVLSDTRLVLHGWLPWRDLILPHGLLRDVVPTAVGWGVFGNSYWGGEAGFFFILAPLAIASTYLLLVYLVGRSWPVLLAGTLIFLGTWLGLGGIDPRFLLWPMLLLLLAALLKQFTRPRAIGLGFLTVVQAILTPEMAAGIPVIALAVVAYEWYWWPPGAPLRQSFRRTVWFAIGTVAVAAAFAIYMASRGALGDLISVTLDLLAGHFGLGIPPSPGAIPSAQYDFIALAPVAALLVSFAYAVVMLRLRRPFRLADWPMGASALYLLFYYTKFLTRMDTHVYQPFMIAIPLLLYIVYRAISAAELWIRKQVSRRHAGWLPSHPLGVALLILFLAYFWGPLHTTVQFAPTAYRPTAPDPPIPHVGYAADYQPPVVNDLRRIINAYLGPHDRLMDLTDEPGIFYYWLGRDESSPWGVPGGGLVDTPTIQRLLIDDLRRERPKLIVFDNVGDPSHMFGLAALDGMPNNVTFYLVSRWILQHYRPLIESHGRIVYALPSVRPIQPARLHLSEQPVTQGLQFLGQPCLWGDTPTFLTGAAQPSPGSESVAARIVARRGQSVTLSGWAGDLQSRAPAREVIATLNGRLIAQATPSQYRPDVPQAGFPRSFVNSGFQLSIPAQLFQPKRVEVYAIGAGDAVTQLHFVGPVAQTGRVTVAGKSVKLAPKALEGHVDSVSPTAPYVEVAPPPGSSWADYRWLEIGGASHTRLYPGLFTLADFPGPATGTNGGHFIDFSTIRNSPSRNIIPAASCPQWQGYGSRPLFLTPPPGQSPTVHLIR